MKAVRGDRIIAAARECLGINFKHQGRGEGGIDCVGLLAYVADRLEIETNDRTDYAKNPKGTLLINALDEQKFLRRIKVRKIKTGDVLVIKIGRNPQHVAIFTGENIIHAYVKSRKVVEHILDDEWRGMIFAAYRIYK